MRGQLERRRWRPDPDLYAPARYRKACAYDAFVPDDLGHYSGFPLSGDLAAMISEAETAISTPERPGAARQLAPLARLLLRTESIASSKVEGLQIDARSLARAEAKQDVRAAASAATPWRSWRPSTPWSWRSSGRPAVNEHRAQKDLVDIHAALLARSAPQPSRAGNMGRAELDRRQQLQPCGAGSSRRRRKTSSAHRRSLRVLQR